MSHQADQSTSTEKNIAETKIQDGAFSREGSVVSNTSSNSEKNSSKPFDGGDDDRPNPGQRGERPVSGGRIRGTPQDSPTIQFYSGNPMVERTCGILHLYKDK